MANPKAKDPAHAGNGIQGHCPVYLLNGSSDHNGAALTFRRRGFKWLGTRLSGGSQSPRQKESSLMRLLLATRRTRRAPLSGFKLELSCFYQHSELDASRTV